jgi:NAD+ diphosphatase
MLRPEAVLPEGLSTVPVRVCFAERPDGASLLRAFHIMQWRADSRFCGSCGHQNGDSTTELARLCPNCGRIEYPRICPAIIVMINRTTERGEEILLAHNKRFKNNMYSLIAGFNEAGESLEETVAREIREEVGVEVKDVRYLTSQSWPFPASLMLGFRARWASGEARPDGVEIGDARWFTRQNVPALPRNGSVAYRIISGWLGHSPEA